MKKQLLYSILAVLIMSGTVFGATYAFFSASVGNSVSQTNSSDMDIVYSGGSPITGTMQQVANRSGGFSTVINIKTASNSVEPKVNMFINIDNITANLAVPGLKWEVDIERSGDNLIHYAGNFDGYNSTTNKVVPIISNYPLTTTNSKITVYIWLDGNSTNNSVLGGSFNGYISASSEQFYAKFT